MKIDNTTYIFGFIILILGLLIFYSCNGSKKHSKNGFTGKTGDVDVTTPIEMRNGGDTTYIFYSPSCGYCVRSMDEFEDAASKCSNIKLINVKDPENEEIVLNYNDKMQGVPTIMKSDGTMYSGKRLSQDIQDFANGKD